MNSKICTMERDLCRIIHKKIFKTQIRCFKIINPFKEIKSLYPHKILKIMQKRKTTKHLNVTITIFKKFIL